MTYRPKTILITGATSDFGVAFARKFSNAGAEKIYLHGRNPEKLKCVQDALPCATQALVCDLTDSAAIDEVFGDLSDIDLLINNAGGALGPENAYNADIEDWDKMVQVNVLALTRITRHILPDMVARKRGHVINISSVAGNWPYPTGHVYCASKAFVTQFSLALRADLIGTKVRVTNIEPGMVETDFSLKRFKGDEEKAKSIYANTRPLHVDDIAETVLFASQLPEHANITRLEIMSADQATGPLAVHRENTEK